MASTASRFQPRKGLSRRSFAIYLYTSERPATETAPAHATVYVPDGRPARLAAGTVLSDADVLELDQRFENARGQLRFLYEREKEFNARIAVLEQALREARAALRAPIGRYLEQPGPIEGWWADGWVGRELRFVMVPRVDAVAFTLGLRAPAGLTAGQQIRLELDDVSVDAEFAPGRAGDITVTRPLRARQPVRVRVQASVT